MQNLLNLTQRFILNAEEMTFLYEKKPPPFVRAAVGESDSLLSQTEQVITFSAGWLRSEGDEQVIDQEGQISDINAGVDNHVTFFEAWERCKGDEEIIYESGQVTDIRCICAETVTVATLTSTAAGRDAVVTEIVGAPEECPLGNP